MKQNFFFKLKLADSDDNRASLHLLHNFIFLSHILCALESHGERRRRRGRSLASTGLALEI